MKMSIIDGVLTVTPDTETEELEVMRVYKHHVRGIKLLDAIQGLCEAYPEDAELGELYQTAGAYVDRPFSS